MKLLVSSEPTSARQVVDVPSVQQEVSVDRVADGREPSRQRHGPADIAPQRAEVVDPHLAVGDVGGHREERQPVVADVGVALEYRLKDLFIGKTERNVW